MAVKKHFEVNLTTRNPGFIMKGAHSHSWYEIFCLQSGSCELTIGDIVWQCRPGAVAIIAPEVPHKTCYTGNTECARVCIEFTPQFVQQFSSSTTISDSFNTITNGVFQLFENDYISFNRFLNELFDEKNSKDAFSDIVCSSILCQVITMIMRNFQKAPDTMEAHPSDNTIQMALLYMEKNYNKDITLSMLADMYHLNTSYFSKKFKAICGTGFKEYLTNLRIINSERLLLETQKSITEIAFLCGFESSNYYGDAFRKKNKVSPSQFRKMKGFNILE